MRRGRQTLPELLRSCDLSPQLVKQAMLVLLQHNHAAAYTVRPDPDALVTRPLYAVSAAAVPPLTISSTVASGPNLSFWTSSWPAGQTFTWTPSARINSCSIPSCTHRTLGYCEKHKKLCKILLIFGFAPARHIFSRHCVVFLVFKVARRRLRHCATFWL